jgi:hypothetical protein
LDTRDCQETPFNCAAIERNKDWSEILGAQTFYADSQATDRSVGFKDARLQLEIAAPCYNKPMKRVRKRMTPRKETRRQMRPIRRAGFMNMLAEAIKTPSTKPVRKPS